jgi:hypothetical protein
MQYWKIIADYFVVAPGEQKRQNACRVKRYWEIIADNLSKARWSWGCVSAIDSNGRTIWIADAADEKLTAFMELESAIRGGSRFAASPG